MGALVCIIIGPVNTFEIGISLGQPPLDQGIVRIDQTIQAHGVDQIGAGGAGTDRHIEGTVTVVGPGAAAVICKGNQRVKFVLSQRQIVAPDESVDFVLKIQHHAAQQRFRLFHRNITAGIGVEFFQHLIGAAGTVTHGPLGIVPVYTAGKAFHLLDHIDHLLGSGHGLHRAGPEGQTGQGADY